MSTPLSGERSNEVTVPEPPGLWVVVTCMGRLAFLKRTFPTVVADGTAGYCLVDYSCPDGAGDWLEASHPEWVRRGQATIVRVPGERFFHKTKALNLGARAARARGAQHLCFADADTVFSPGAFATLGALVGRGRFVVAGRGANGGNVRSLTGFLVVEATEFERSGGYDESFEDWGSEDIEMRLRLHLRCGLEPAFVPEGAVSALQHGHWLRTQFHRQRDLYASATRNEALLRARVREWTGQVIESLPESAKQLMFSLR